MADSFSDAIINEETILETCEEQDIPQMGIVEQTWETDSISSQETESVARNATENLDLEEIPEEGEVAVGVGSRGIANISRITRGTVKGLQNQGYNVFIFPAMGSHGGATAKGQREQLASLGITEEAIGCEIRATMDVVKVSETPDREVGVYSDASAIAADAILPINRIKPHTTFYGDVESGLSKMLVIGMGKQEGAKVAHDWAVDWSFRNMIPEIAATLVENLPVIGGIAIVEDQHHDTAVIEGVPPEDFLDREAELLETAYDLLPTLPWDDIDVVIFDQMGKEISGAGMDTNVIGRLPHFYEPEPDSPSIRRIFTRSLTEASHGNAAGVGNADLIHSDVLNEWNPETTLINGITSSSLRVQRLPPVVGSDRAGFVAALSTIGIEHNDKESARVVRAVDTQHLQRFYASETLVKEARDRDDLRVVKNPQTVGFDDHGAFTDPPAQ